MLDLISSHGDACLHPSRRIIFKGQESGRVSELLSLMDAVLTRRGGGGGGGLIARAA